MKIIGCDFHARYQQIAMLDQTTGEKHPLRKTFGVNCAEARRRLCFAGPDVGTIMVGQDAERPTR